MKKIFMKSSEERALIKSIKHWEKDIIKYFEKGWTIYSDNGFLNWIKIGKMVVSDKEVDCYASNCALCVLKKTSSCKDCVYTRYYGISCEDEYKCKLRTKRGHWIKFKTNPCLKTATAMRDSLVKILKNKKDEK